MRITTDSIKAVLAPFRPAVVYVFGSQATGDARPDSDLDLGFVPGTPCDAYAVFLAAQELARVAGCDVDLIDLSRATAVMKAEVLRSGRRLLVDDIRRTAEFEMYALSDYARTNEERSEVLSLLGCEGDAQRRHTQ